MRLCGGSNFGDFLYPLYESVCRQLVASARERLTVEVAGRSIADWLGVPLGAPIIVVQRVAFDFARTPIEEERSQRVPLLARQV